MSNFTEREIKAAFIDLLNERPLHKISVKDIVEKCGINRNSFYYHFQDIPTLIEEILMEQMETLIGQYPTMEALDDCVDAIIQVSMKNRKAILNIFHSANRALFEEYLMKLCDTMVTKYVYTLFGKSMTSEKDREICIWAIRCELFGMLMDWCIHGLREEDTRNIHRLLELVRGIPTIVIAQSNADSTQKPRI